jgi:hypothetical protein
MPQDQIICKCGSTDYHTEQSGVHVKAICNVCDSYIKFLPQGATGDSEMYFGMHKGKKLKDIPPDYLLYMYDNNKVSGSVKQWIKDNKPALVQRSYESK